MVRHYSLGFMFNKDKTEVVLIKKNKPDYLAGKWNGIGGLFEHEKDGDIHDCMVREFHEEAGVVTNKFDWKYYLKFDMVQRQMTVHCFYCVSDEYFRRVVSQTDEPITGINLERYLLDELLVSNLKWLIGLALDENRPRTTIWYP